MHSQASSKAGRPPVAKKFNCKVSANRGIAEAVLGGYAYPIDRRFYVACIARSRMWRAPRPWRRVVIAFRINEILEKPKSPVCGFARCSCWSRQMSGRLRAVLRNCAACG